MIDEQTRHEIERHQSPAEQRARGDQLPAWVKCMYCGCRPTYGNLLGEVIPKSSALACEKCMAERGKIFGLNAGTIQEIDGKIKAPEGTNDSAISA